MALDVAMIAPTDLEFYWGLVEPLLVDVVRDYGAQENWTLDQVKEGVLSDKLQLWVGYDPVEQRIHIAMVTSVTRHKNGERYVTLVFVGGARLKETFHFFEQFKELARSAGADALLTYARPGSRRLLTRHLGFQFVTRTNLGHLLFYDLIGNTCTNKSTSSVPPPGSTSASIH